MGYFVKDHFPDKSTFTWLKAFLRFEILRFSFSYH